MGKISKKIINEYKKGRLDNIIDLSEIREAKEKIKEINKLTLENYDPSHKIYLLIQNILSYLSEEISILDELTEYYDLIIEQEEEYMPSYPPNSPLSGSYYTYWCFCDFKFGKDKETINTILYDLGRQNNFDNLLIKGIENLDKSCMKFYKHQGIENDMILLEDIMSNEKYTCLSTSNYIGKKGEIWFVRMVPNLDEKYNYQIVLTTPYIIQNNTERDWIEFYERQGIKKGEKGYEIKYEEFMKDHSDKKYWHNYLMDGYLNYESNCIYLTGIPDIDGSKPHELKFE